MKPKHSDLLHGFTLIELVIVVTLLTFLVATTFNTFLTGQALWLKVDRAIELEDSLRKSFDRIAPELEMSGHDKHGTFQIVVTKGGGVNSSDIVRFSIPVICQTNGNPVDAEGQTAHWGAPLSWGCAEPSCMDADNNCDTVDYKYIEYLLNDHETLIRRVLDYSQNIVREDPIASHIVNFQTQTNFNQKVVTVTLTAKMTITGKAMANASLQRNIYLRNAR